ARDTSGTQEPGPDKLRVDLEEALKSAQAYKDQFLRKAAEFENFKRRSETEYLNTVRNANEILIGALLPIVEDFTRSLKAGVNGGEGEAFYRGVELIYQKLMKVLEGQGLAPFESSGKPFDVDYHDALLQVPRDDVPPGTVIEEISRGYTLNDRVLRHAKVVVSAAAQPESAPEGSPTDGGSKESTGH
ncbi:MAG TPA: nucleotide exchange factor GrpE, partial [Bacteroidota bacterium]|nr:nucleotide exchange factor GrpE [Bacteroidota bacterium]